MPWPILLLVLAAVVLIARTMLHKLGIGKYGGKPDCGCGSGAHCKTHSQKEKN